MSLEASLDYIIYIDRQTDRQTDREREIDR